MGKHGRTAFNYFLILTCYVSVCLPRPMEGTIKATSISDLI